MKLTDSIVISMTDAPAVISSEEDVCTGNYFTSFNRLPEEVQRYFRSVGFVPALGGNVSNNSPSVIHVKQS